MLNQTYRALMRNIVSEQLHLRHVLQSILTQLHYKRQTRFPMDKDTLGDSVAIRVLTAIL
jgi:hypothetical protein